MTKLPFKTTMQLLDAFANGAQFSIFDIPVTNVTELSDGRIRVSFGSFRYVDGINPDGSHPNDMFTRLVMVKAAPEGVPFLKRFVLGEPAHCPRTREVVESLTFFNNELVVTLVNEDGVSRESQNYTHEGKHKHAAARSLVFGALPSLPKAGPKTYSIEDLLKTAPVGAYKLTCLPTKERLIVLANTTERCVLYVSPTSVAPVTPDLWIGLAFVHTSNSIELSVKE